MSHPYQSHREKHPGKSRVHKLYGYARGGKVKSDAAEDAAMIKKAIGDHDRQLHGGKHTDLANIGPKGKGRMDKYARGGKVKKAGKTTININIASKEPNNVPPPLPPMAGPPPGPPMPPKPPMGPPPGGPPMGSGLPPGLGMKRGGGVKSGISSSENLKKWASYASSNTRYERGGKVPMKSGADSGPGRLEKIKAYGKGAKKK